MQIALGGFFMAETNQLCAAFYFLIRVDATWNDVFYVLAQIIISGLFFIYKTKKVCDRHHHHHALFCVPGGTYVTLAEFSNFPGCTYHDAWPVALLGNHALTLSVNCIASELRQPVRGSEGLTIASFTASQRILTCMNDKLRLWATFFHASAWFGRRARYCFTNSVRPSVRLSLCPMSVLCLKEWTYRHVFDALVWRASF